MHYSRDAFTAFTESDVQPNVPRMARSWPASLQAGILSFGGLLSVIVIVMVSHRSRPWMMAVSLAVPLLIFAAFTVYEWWAGRRLGVKLTRLHLIGVAAGLLVWLMYQRAPGSLPFHPTSRELCEYVGLRGNHACLVKASTARLRSDIVWWSTGALIAVFGLFAHRSRTAAWVGPAIAIAGGALALYYLEVFVRAAAHDGFLV